MENPSHLVGSCRHLAALTADDEANLAGASRLSRYPPARRAPPQACRRACPGRTTQGCTCGHANSLSAVRVGAGAAKLLPTWGAK